MADSLKSLLSTGQLVTAPGVFDAVSARLANQTAVGALYLTGYGTVASYKGLPDAGIATYTDMVDRVEAIASGIDKPLIADGDTGYGGLLNVHHTVRGYERAGAAAIQLEDQEIPKKCGHTPNRRVVPVADMVRKVRVACDARSSEEFLIIARTDALSSLGLEAALGRGEAYVRAGADILFIEAPETIEQMTRIGASFDIPVMINQVHGGKTPILPPAQLRALGFALAIYPVTGLLAAAQALTAVYEALAQHESVRLPLYSFDDFGRLMGFQKVWDFERRCAALWPDEDP